MPLLLLMSLAFGWPKLLITKLAVAYTGRSRSMLTRAAQAGALPVAGRNGRSLVFDRDALDAWMTGGSRVSDIPITSKRSAAPATSTNALARLRSISRGAP